MKCSTCGAENEAANRFCEQCGSRLEPSGAVPQAQVDLAAQPTAAGPTCPSCGAAVLPGEAFCDECGAALSSAVPAATGVGAASGAAYDAPTMIAPPPPAAARGAPVDGHSVVCPACGHQNLPGDRFCDNCGAALPAPAAAGSPAAQAEAPTVLSDQALLQSLHAAAPEPSAAAQAEAPTVEQPAIEPAANAAQEAYEAERRRLTEEVERQQKIITQFEQMQAMFGAATPAAVSQGLAEARDARARAEAELAALTGGAAAAAPAAAPAAAATSAPAALGELGTVPAPAAAVPVEPPVPAPQTTVSEPAREPVPAPAAPSAPPAPAAEAPKAPAAPRLVTDDGKELPLPADKREIIVGREDPISGIFPEIDLTPYGGETGGVSRQHARISQVDGQWTVTDLQSTNYTRVDGARIEPNVPVPIKSGARLQFGRVALVFQA